MYRVCMESHSNMYPVAHLRVFSTLCATTTDGLNRARKAQDRSWLSLAPMLGPACRSLQAQHGTVAFIMFLCC